MPDEADGSLLEGEEEEASEPPRSNLGEGEAEEGGADAALESSAGPQPRRRSALLLAALILGAYLRLRSGTAALLVATELVAVAAFVSRAAAAVSGSKR